jgi:hypothetical protein
MIGEVRRVWTDLMDHVWGPLSTHERAPADFWSELYQEMSRFFTEDFKFGLSGLEKEDLTDGVFHERDWMSSRGFVEPANDPGVAEAMLAKIEGSAFLNEESTLGFLESFYYPCFDFGGDPLANEYFLLMEAFAAHFNLRYDVRRPLSLCPTLPGLFSGLLAEIKKRTSHDDHLFKLLHEFEEAVRELRNGCDEGRIKTCLNKQYMLIEGLADESSLDEGKTLGELLKSVDWPHVTLKNASGSLYGFRSDYPGIGHGTRSKGAKRDLDMRELLGVSLMVAGLAPYATDQLDLNAAYGSVGNPRPRKWQPRGVD